LQFTIFFTILFGMKKPFAPPVIQALPAIDVPDPGISPLALLAGRLGGRIYLHGSIGWAKIRLPAAQPLVSAFERCLSGKSRCILAFRHQNGWEPQALAWFVMTGLSGSARKEKVTFARAPFLTFVHGYEVFRWGGPLARWLLPRIGAIPVHHVKLDSKGLTRIYRVLETGPYPLTLAPEGQVSYTLSAPIRIESGAVRIGVTVAERLQAQGSDAAVEILPASLFPQYDENQRQDLERYTRMVERICGLPSPSGGDLRERFLRLREAILGANEARYGLTPGDGADFPARLDAVIEAALERAAAILGISGEPPTEDPIRRLYAVRQVCWDRIFPEDAAADLSPLEQSILDLRAGEAWHASRHMETADFSWYFHQPPAEPLTLNAAIEYAQNLYDFANRTRGGAFTGRKLIPPREVRIAATEPINLTDMLTAAGGNGRKALIAEANERILAAFETLAAFPPVGRRAEPFESLSL
jgi:hypothetical protein